MFLEQAFNPIENRPTLSKEEIESALDNRFGPGERPVDLPENLDGVFNIPKEGEQQAPDILNGTWRTAGNVPVYTPGHKVTSEQAQRMRLYFAQNMEGVALDLKNDKIYKDPVLPKVQTSEPGWFGGFFEGVGKAPINTGFRMISGALMASSKLMPWVREDFLQQLEQASADLDKWNRANFGVDPETMGKATQAVYGLVNMIPELMLYTTPAGRAAGMLFKGIGATEKIRKTSLAVGSALFGADMGVSERNRLVGEGVDKDTAFNAGITSGLTNGIGALIPPFLGSSRMMSALYGAGSNVALNWGEMAGISYILKNQDYAELAKQYELNTVDALVSAGMGAFMGAAFWRNPIDVKYDKAQTRLYERYKSDIDAGGKFKPEESKTQADINSRAVVSLARIADISPDKMDEFAANITWSDDRKTLSVPEYAMPITQGNEWHMGPTKASPDEMISVVFYKGQAPDRKTALAQIESFSSKGLKNEETGFVLSVSRSDLKKSFAGYNSYDERVLRAIAPIFDRVVAKARLLESTPDLQHGNPHVQGIHIFGAPVGIDGGLYRVQLLVRDYVTPGQERLATHKVSGIKIYEIENPPVSRTDGGTSDIRGVTAPDIRLSGRPVAPSDHAISLSQFVGGRKPYVRQDGKGLFDPVDDTSRTEGGVYYERQNELPQAFYQVAYHGSPYLFDAFTLAHIGSGEGMQAHGWGLYFALSRQTAVGYRNALSGDATYTYKGKDLQILRDEIWKEFLQANDDYYKTSSFLKQRELLKKRVALKAKVKTLDAFYYGGMSRVDKRLASGELNSDAVSWFKNEIYPDIKQKSGGRIYTVDIPDDDVMLNEQLPLDQQPAKVQEALKSLLDDGVINTSMTGGRIYRTLSDRLLSDRSASIALNKIGIKGIRYNGRRDGECAVVWDEQSIKILEYLQKGQEGIRGAFNPSTNTIRLTPNANLSTFSHEHSHWYLTNVLALAGKEGATLELQLQEKAILQAFGIKDLNEWNALGFEGKRKYQEQFASWTEIYLTQGKSPVKGLEGVFAKMAEWLVGMYKSMLGKDAGPDAAVKEVSERYQAQFGEKLPELSPEVRKVLDTMYGAQQKRSAFKSSGMQTMGGRIIQAQRVNHSKVSAPVSDPHGPEAGNVGQAAQGKAVSDLNNGRKVDVSEQVGDAEANVPVVEDTQSTFARGVSIGDGDNSRVVVLQNRNRSDPNSVAQMNSIATDPQYGRLSTSRTTQSGAPIVSFGHLPDKAYQGKSEVITESNGNKVPVTYYVVEADDVMRSNNYDGTPNKEWNNDNPDRMRAIAGNGRMAGLSEAYNRGTAEQYRQDLMADSENHGVSPETIQGMKKPVLVRYMPPESVTTGFVERSNTSDVLVRSSLETAVQDSPKVRRNIGKYEFDEDGDPTKETLGQFLTDVGEVSEMGNLIDSNGNPTTAARNRIKAAVFYEAYRDRRLTELVADSEDKQGIKRILSAMSAFAPHVIQIRETSGGLIDLAPIITDATHRILQARINGEGVDFTAQGDMFSSNPATEMMTNFLSQNRNSAAAMLRVLRPFAAQVENALQAADSPMFADLAVKTDLADAMALFRKAENEEIRNRSGDLLGDAKDNLLPDIDVEAMRTSLTNTIEDGKNLVDTMAEAVEETNRMATPEAKAEALQQHLIEQQNAREVLTENSEAVRARNFALDDPNRQLVMTDENGNEVAITAKEAMEQTVEIDQNLNDDTAGLGMGVACIIRNQGIRKS